MGKCCFFFRGAKFRNGILLLPSVCSVYYVSRWFGNLIVLAPSLEKRGN